VRRPVPAKLLHERHDLSPARQHDLIEPAQVFDCRGAERDRRGHGAIPGALHHPRRALLAVRAGRPV
jgi:hypothetical protein